MNNRQLYLAWLRTTSPAVYASAVRKALGQTRSLGGLADDLVNKAFSPDLAHSFLGDDTDFTDESSLQTGSSNDLTTLPTDFTNVSDVSAPQPVSISSGTAVGLPTTSGSSTGNIFASIISAVGSVGGAVINATNQSKLIALNTQRAAQGLPPINANGQVVGTTGLATTSPGLLAFENAISGAGGSMMPILFLGIGAIVLFSLLGKKAA